MNLGRTYAIVNWADVTDTMASMSAVGDKDDLRRSVSGTDRAIVSWDGSTPSGLESYTTYNHAQMKAIVDDQSGDWYEPPYEP